MALLIPQAERNDEIGYPEETRFNPVVIFIRYE